jgi:hypothetical protein
MNMNILAPKSRKLHRGLSNTKLWFSEKVAVTVLVKFN